VHRFADGSRWHTIVRSGTYDRDLRASAVRFCVQSATNPACTPGPVTLENLSPATTLNRGTNNKVQDLTSTYVQTDVQASWRAFGMTHDVLGGVDYAREEFNNYALVLPAGVMLDKNTPRPVIGTPNDGTAVDESLRSKLLNRNFVARALGVYAQDLLQVAEHWKLLAGLRWDRFEGNYTSPSSTTLPAASRSDSLWSHRLGVLYQPNEHATVYASYGTSFNTSGDLYNYDAPGSRADPEKSRNIEVGTKLDLFDGRLSSRVSAFHSTKYNERNRDSPTGQPLTDYLLSGKRHAAGLELDLAGRITPRWEVYGSYAWIPLAKIDEAAFGVDLAGEREGSRPSLTPRHSGTIWTTYQVTSALRVGAGLNARSSQTPNRNPPGIVAPRFVTADLLAEYAFNDSIAFKVNVVNVTDKLYADSVYTGHYIPGQARTLYVTMSARY
jgi:catecholate siderophore receptor